MQLRTEQTKTINTMLNLGQNDQGFKNWEQAWKILIYDKHCENIIAPLLLVGDLRKLGITLHLHLHADRQIISETPAIYFIQPTEENIQRIIQDCNSGLYDLFYLNFCGSLPENLFEKLAGSLVKANAAQRIVKICEQHTDFLALEQNLFSFNIQNTYQSLSLPGKNEQIVLEKALNSIFSLILTMNTIPIIQAPKYLEGFAKQIENKLRELIKSGATFSTAQRPVFILLDRNIDLSVMFSHSWIYQALVHDFLDMKLNKVQVEIQDQTNNIMQSKTKFYSLDKDDSFWVNSVAKMFPQIAVEINEQLNEYTRTKESVSKIYQDNDSNNESRINNSEIELLDKTKELGAFMSVLPQLQEKKKQIDKHINIGTSLLKKIQERNIDSFINIEESILSRSNFDRQILHELIRDPTKGLIEDKIRLLLIYILSSDSIQTADIQPLEQELERLGCTYISQLIEFVNQRVKPLSSLSTVTNSSVLRNNSFTQNSFMQRGFSSFADLVKTSVNYLRPNTQDLCITRLVESLLEAKTNFGTDSYLYLDAYTPIGSLPRRQSNFQEAIVFVLGGGNYLEYHNLQEFVKKQNQQRKPLKNLIYGTTDFVTPAQMLQQLKSVSEQTIKK
eukprot:TRINITY_DN7831_c0_g1_i1.p1 TRINITY_DN7831_c0_g1~~TRINITY_DN7831_c0_g1_i1.p1  ORF type:complete len:618 (+),score=237.00 TRINITY_DN7831_c0_g1_i1:96-1949(+)